MGFAIIKPSLVVLMATEELNCLSLLGSFKYGLELHEHFARHAIL
jgi:hypothetical protein